MEQKEHSASFRTQPFQFNRITRHNKNFKGFKNEKNLTGNWMLLPLQKYI